MNRIYQNEKVLMREVGLLKTYEMTAIKHEITTIEGTVEDFYNAVDKLNKQQNVIGVESRTL